MVLKIELYSTQRITQFSDNKLVGLWEMAVYFMVDSAIEVAIEELEGRKLPVYYRLVVAQ
jgi:hypothetical protein